AVDLDHTRIQFTPDLMPSDVTGSLVWDASASDFEFRPGPVFTNVLIADEINRTPPKTQSALLEAMEEHQVSVGGRSRSLPEPFLVAAT
ncbi:AAA family ATPase, partial [Mycobacterium tuberculosis]|nr:AAA family ATPase [Mycobacterium tuberculosis]